MNKGIAVVGSLRADNVKICDKFSQPGTFINIKEASRSIGGCASNISAAIAKINPEINLVTIGKVGEDGDAELVRDTLASLGVDVEGIVSTPEKHTSFSDIMYDEEANDTIIFQSRGADALFGIEDIDFTKLNVDIFHIGYALPMAELDKADDEYPTVMARLLNGVSQMGIKTSLHVVSHDDNKTAELVAPCLEYCDYLILNEVEASRVTGIEVRDESGKISHSAIKTVINELFEKGVREVVCVHSAEGGWLSQKGSGIYFQPSLNLAKDAIKTRVGTGDAFCAGILYSLYNDFDDEYSLRVAGAAAACSLTEINSIDGLRAFDKMMEFESEIGYEM